MLSEAEGKNKKNNIIRGGPKWQRNRMERPLSPPQIRQKII